MNPAEVAEDKAHDVLRDAIRAAALALWDRRAVDDADDEDALAELEDARPVVEQGLLLDYVVVAVFDNGNRDFSLNVILRTDGKAARYRVDGLLIDALADHLT